MSILIVSSGLPLPSVTVGVAATFRSPVPVVPTVPIGPSGGRYIPVLQARFQAFPTTPTVPFNNQWWPLHPRSPGTFPGSPNPQSRLSLQALPTTTIMLFSHPIYMVYTPILRSFSFSVRKGKTFSLLQ